MATSFMKNASDTDIRIREALREIIDGKEVSRQKHELVYDGRSVVPTFLDELRAKGFRETAIGDLEVEPGQRVPAFHLENSTAYFGWIFWEQFTSWKLRKLFGSVVKNSKGDWLVQIPAGSARKVFANPDLKIEMDIDHPPELW